MYKRQRNPISIQNIYSLGEYDGHYGYTYRYGDIVENKVLKPRKIDLSPAASHFSIKSIISGHGHEGPNHCCEWVEKSHYFFINELKDKNKMKPLSLIANEINERLETLKKTVYSNQGIPEPKKPDVKDTKLSGGAKKMTLDNLSSKNLERLKDSSDSNIRTIFIQSNHDENLYITADKRTNSIYVTFRGTQSIKNALSDANILPYKGCDGNLLKELEGGFSLKSMKASAAKMSKKARDKASSMKKTMKNKLKSVSYTHLTLPTKA